VNRFTSTYARKKSYGERLVAKFEREHPGGDGHAYAEYASKNAWKAGSAAAHDEAAKAHDSVAHTYVQDDATRNRHIEQAHVHDDAAEKAARGEKPKPPQGGTFEEDEHARDDKGRFAPK
jgi:hypothetical protein